MRGETGTDTVPSARELSDRLCGSSSNDPLWADHARTLDRRALHQEVDRCLDLLAASGVQPGDCVAVQLAPHTTLFALLLAIWRLDARAMLLDHRLTESETASLTRLCPPAFHVRATTEPTHFTHPTRPRVEPLTGAVALPDTVCLVQFTSGSTGRSKVVGRSAVSLDQEIDRYAAIDDMPGPDDRLLLLCSPVHTWGLVGGILHGLATGTPVLLPSERHGQGIARTAAALEPTAVFGVPTHFELLASTAARMPRLRVAASAGMTTSAAVAERFHRATGCRLGQVYGMTEAGVLTADLAGRIPAPSVGRPAPGITVRATGGELHVRLDQTPYLVDDGVPRFADGWLRTFDRATIDQTSGAVSIHGRADSVIAIGGIKIDLVEVEQVLQQHPDITHAVVTFQDVIEAHVAARPGLTDRALAAWTRQRLSSLKTPKRYFLRDELPRTPTGKVVRDRAQLLSATRQRRTTAPGEGARPGPDPRPPGRV